jgi:hypothetical protein
VRKALSLAVLACALMVGIACSDSPTPSAPAVATTNAAVATEVSLESASKIYLCHGDKSEPTLGLVVEVSSEYYKRHLKHINAERDCVCTDYGDVGEPCNPYSGGDQYCDNSCPG